MYMLCATIDYCYVFCQPENLLLDAYGNLKISDFGLSALSQQVRVMTICFYSFRYSLFFQEMISSLSQEFTDIVVENFIHIYS